MNTLLKRTQILFIFYFSLFIINYSLIFLDLKTKILSAQLSHSFRRSSMKILRFPFSLPDNFSIKFSRTPMLNTFRTPRLQNFYVLNQYCFQKNLSLIFLFFWFVIYYFAFGLKFRWHKKQRIRNIFTFRKIYFI